MDLLYFRAARGNFGDELNQLIWPSLLPADVLSASHVALVGVGTVLGQAYFRSWQTEGKRVLVLGSGAGYGALPSDCRDFEYLAVRGQLTAALVGREESAATDAAALLAKTTHAPAMAEARDAILFMPHHHSVPHGRWEETAARAGCEYVSPCWPTARILSAFSRARLVVAEAMHGAIVADTLRVPWIPAFVSPAISQFKWRDWTASLELELDPMALLPSSRLEALRCRRLPRAFSVRDRADMESWLSAFRAEQANPTPGVVPITMWPPLKSAIKRVVAAYDEPFIRDAASRLAEVARGRSYLSSDAVFQERLGRLSDAVERCIERVRQG